eukprot:CAMPEP_0197654340 /NCGR_PEP_ID=MMETSP1338-20131121/38797_1 /TAXON_ID=43686 ORGANISM="Pelagodinium beii, Strain RCC1491" /NCGR_SAMPLE_ID=MMETSP1338 /ASSEMBLY_ACC=CAM_ASM_000754 /LENGTH=100 /DNA_ID=CAMNT_0043229775 /DNA_START=68 /DNA_END=370 /DNA_ORIENTATION=+
MVQKSLSLNKNKQAKGGKPKKAQASKLDILQKKKKKDKNATGLAGASAAFIRKLQTKTEENVAAKTQVEGGAQLSTVHLTPQQVAKAEKAAGKRPKKNSL